MKNYIITCSEWKHAEPMQASPALADELFTALCDYYGIDSGDIKKTFRGYGDELIHAIAKDDENCTLEIKQAKD